MARYRWFVKTWDPHFGDGHAVAQRFWEGRASKKSNAQAVAELENALRTRPPKGKSVALAEVSDRFGTETLAKFEADATLMGKEEDWKRVK